MGRVPASFIPNETKSSRVSLRGGGGGAVGGGGGGADVGAGVLATHRYTLPTFVHETGEPPDTAVRPTRAFVQVGSLAAAASGDAARVRPTSAVNVAVTITIGTRCRDGMVVSF
jgi:hypothetical protein